jgi:hypothetical protein
VQKSPAALPALLLAELLEAPNTKPVLFPFALPVVVAPKAGVIVLVVLVDVLGPKRKLGVLSVLLLLAESACVVIELSLSRLLNACMPNAPLGPNMGVCLDVVVARLDPAIHSK